MNASVDENAYQEAQSAFRGDIIERMRGNGESMMLRVISEDHALRVAIETYELIRQKNLTSEEK